VEDDADEEKEHEEGRVVPKEFGADGGQSKVERRDLEKALEIDHEVLRMTQRSWRSIAHLHEASKHEQTRPRCELQVNGDGNVYSVAEGDLPDQRPFKTITR
jgi:hypothetical protein